MLSSKSPEIVPSYLKDFPGIDARHSATVRKAEIVGLAVDRGACFPESGLHAVSVRPIVAIKLSVVTKVVICFLIVRFRQYRTFVMS